jgi:hypothetical protein
LPDFWAALQPQRAFRWLAAQPLREGAWLAVRRPVFVAFALACGVTLMAAEPFDPRLVASNMLSWAFVPLCEALALVAVVWRFRERMALSRAVDLYFTGHAPWLLWFTCLSFDWSLQAPHRAPTFMFSHFAPLAAGTLLVMAWSCYVDYCCFHIAFARSRRGAVVALAVQRVTSWAAIIFIFGWETPLAEFAGRAVAK